MQKYRSLGIKLTPQRIAILDFLADRKTHPSAEDIYKTVSKQFSTMSFATVYNTIEALRQKGSVKVLTIDPDKKRYEPNLVPHNHLICIKCKNIVDIHAEFKLPLSKNAVKGFELLGSHVEFYGICNKCKK